MDFDCLKAEIWGFFFSFRQDIIKDHSEPTKQQSANLFLGKKVRKTDQCADTHWPGSRRCCCRSPLRWSQADTHTGSCPGCCGTEHGFCKAWRDTHQYPLCIFPLKCGESKGETSHRSWCQHWKHNTFPTHVTFPARSTLAAVAFRVRRFLADSRVLTRIRGTRRNHDLAVHTWRTEWEKAEECAAKSLVLLGRMNKEVVTHTIIPALPHFEKSQQKQKESRALLMGSL